MTTPTELSQILRDSVDEFNAVIEQNALGSHVDLRDADLSGLDLRTANINGADLTNANLSGCSVDGAVLGRCRLQGAKLADLEVDSYWQKILFQIEAIWRGPEAWREHNPGSAPVMLAGADFSRAVLAGINFDNVVLNHSKLDHADLSGCQLKAVSLEDASLSGINLEFSKIEFSSLSRANLVDAKVRDAKLHFVNLDGANISNASFAGATIEGGQWLHAIGPATQFDRAEVTRVLLNYSRLTGSSFRDAILSHCSFIETNLDDVDFEGSQFLECTDLQTLETGEFFLPPTG